MPELPEVEVVRRGLQDHVAGRRIVSAAFTGARVARRHVAGPIDLAERIVGLDVVEARRRGKYLWLVLGDDGHPGLGLIAHLGMSGQLLVEASDAPDEKHLHARFTFSDGDPELRFVDQRTFGGFALDDLGDDGVPDQIRHIAPDPFEAGFDQAAVVRRIKASDSAVKRMLLHQGVVSGIGNIYADEALWRAQVHGERPSSTLTKPTISRVLDHARDVMAAALLEGGTSFDALYVNVNGASGYFDRSLHAYGQEGEPCARCGTPIRREQFMNRSSFSCPKCQPRPRVRRTLPPRSRALARMSSRT
ncbi:5-hydroxymethyluracil DNA glycosylase [Knoellia sinensis KCTC 19936]|uniref:Formamidopyrimidine-DNA glycosylase n=1 Tax=Knoellia sinensis KCTC 19936 TaxID=1385520 RepID=A0A0A0J397_9MICO|nr:bifunctional DNA-formamidopyrimidine glycosylase/DNA-(apurinic or apyrimidinic site) lyase [Knoellia sinensis]KGN31850.1 5-hydroxymethyluracil DNA glycosylase [Knoellia sinensis KCTC 19936]